MWFIYVYFWLVGWLSHFKEGYLFVKQSYWFDFIRCHWGLCSFWPRQRGDKEQYRMFSQFWWWWQSLFHLPIGASRILGSLLSLSKSSRLQNHRCCHFVFWTFAIWKAFLWLVLRLWYCHQHHYQGLPSLWHKLYKLFEACSTSLEAFLWLCCY